MMEEKERTRRVQATLGRVLPVINVQQAVLGAAFELLDAVDFPAAMINSEAEPSLAFALHGRVGQALDDLGTLAESLAEAAILTPASARQAYLRTVAGREVFTEETSCDIVPRSASPGGRNR